MAVTDPAASPVLRKVLGQSRRTRHDPRRYSRFVNAMRLVLPLLAMALLTVFAAWPILQQREDAQQFNLQLQRIGPVDDDLKMVHPQYTGTNAFGRSYSVKADTAIPDSANPKEVTLSVLSAIIRDPSGRTVAVTAEEGIYYVERGLIVINGDVRVGASGGLKAKGTEAVLDLGAARLTSSYPFQAEGPWGTLEANSLEAEQNEGVMRFDRGVRVVIQNLPDAADKTEGADQ